MSGHVIKEQMSQGYVVHIDETLGHLWVEHCGEITWDILQAIKNDIWGFEARAVEVYPAQYAVVNNRQMRHLWRLGQHDFCPDLRGITDKGDNLEARFARAWGGT
ncbi:hypothetical protein [Phaeobacter inhibens]|uniref:DUF7694 domain-containing protein n=1 Tax=Phaeobacter inhibens TaxID=221822 RepID=UPI00076BB50A|nr:hypothetical protein [Phaeobacter inhibens]KXF92100.1 hypothetical protein AT574_03860 [Phaeobacter inhibens]WHP69935.1 hypothetical protein QMZ01_07105 [Phaeobacter inhibens]